MHNETGFKLVKTPIPGKILSVSVNKGDRVEKDQVVAVLESLKMEHEITSPHSGLVHAIEVAADDRVIYGTPILVLQSQ